MVLSHTEIVSTPLPVGLAQKLTEEALRSRGIVDPARWAATLLSAVLDVPHIELAGRQGQTLTEGQARRLRELVDQSTSEAPVAYLVG